MLNLYQIKDETLENLICDLNEHAYYVCNHLLDITTQIDRSMLEGFASTNPFVDTFLSIPFALYNCADDYIYVEKTNFVLPSFVYIPNSEKVVKRIFRNKDTLLTCYMTVDSDKIISMQKNNYTLEWHSAGLQGSVKNLDFISSKEDFIAIIKKDLKECIQKMKITNHYYSMISEMSQGEATPSLIKDFLELTPYNTELHVLLSLFSNQSTQLLLFPELNKNGVINKSNILNIIDKISLQLNYWDEEDIRKSDTVAQYHEKRVSRGGKKLLQQLEHIKSKIESESPCLINKFLLNEKLKEELTIDPKKVVKVKI